MRLIWATTDYPPTDDDLAAAKNAGATEIVQIPCDALPDLILGFNPIPTEEGDPGFVAPPLPPPPPSATKADLVDRLSVLLGASASDVTKLLAGTLP